MTHPSNTFGFILMGALTCMSCSRCGSKASPEAAKPGETVDVGQPVKPAQPTASHTPGAMLDVGSVITTDDMPAAMKKGPPISSERIQGIAQTPGYDSRRFFVPGSPDLGLAVQWWRYGTNSEAVIRYMKDLKSYDRAAPSEEVATHSFRSVGNHAIVLVYFDDPKHSVVALTCGASACGFPVDAGPSPDAWSTLVQLAKAVDGRLPNGG